MSFKIWILSSLVFAGLNLLAAQSRGTLVVQIPAQGGTGLKIVHFDDTLPKNGSASIAQNLAEKAEAQIADGQAVSVDECEKIADQAEKRYRRIARHPSRYEIQKIRSYVCEHAKESGSDYDGVYGSYYVRGRVGQAAKSLSSYYPGLSQAYVGLHPNFHFPIALYSGAFNPWGGPWTPWGYSLFRYGYWYLYYW
jgi:hypothetical protein